MTRKKPGKPASDKSDIVAEVPAACADEAKAVEFLERRRWGDTPCCVHCGSVNVYQMKDAKTGERSKRFLWRCHDCKSQYTVRVRSVFEDSRIPLRHWCYGFWAACASKKGVSALQIKRMTGLSYKSALFMMHRIRFAMTTDPTPPKLSGVVEVDETFCGGRTRKHVSPEDRRKARMAGKKIPWHSMTPVVALVERGGNVRTRIVEKITPANLRSAILDHVAPGSLVVTDERPMYRRATAGHVYHERVNHSKGEYVRADNPMIYTNTVESFFSLIKRGLYGTFHAVSKRRLPLYLAEFEFRYNARKVDDGARTEMAIRAAAHKRLMYREPVKKSA